MSLGTRTARATFSGYRLYSGTQLARLNRVIALKELGRWIDANGHRSTGYSREFYLECPEDLADWVTEIQEPVAK